MSLERRLLEVAQDADIGDILKPPRGHLVEMLQGVKGAAIEQAGFGIGEVPLHFSFRLRTANTAGLWSEAVMRGEDEELGIIESAVGVVTQDHGFEVVVQADAGYAAEMMEGMHVFPHGRR